MNKPLFDFFEKDHRRVEALLEKAAKDIHAIDMSYYDQFRAGLLTHIKMEEKVLFPAAQEANGGTPLPLQAQLRLEHGAITSLMTLPPNRDTVKVIWHVLEQHDLKEERPGGMYDACEKLTKERTDELLTQLRQTTQVPIHPVNPHPTVLVVTKRSLLRAGFDFEDIVK